MNVMCFCKCGLVACCVCGPAYHLHETLARATTNLSRREDADPDDHKEAERAVRLETTSIVTTTPPPVMAKAEDHLGFSDEVTVEVVRG